MLMVHVNGKDYEVEQDTKLMRFLRDDLRLTSVKDGCSQGACGTCTVLVDGKATRACIPMLSKLQGKRSLCICICKGRRGAVRILHSGHGDVRQGASGSESGPEPC